MTPSELVAQCRREIDDVVSPYLWSDGDLYHYLDVAQQTFARETLIFSDATTAEVCSTAVIADEKFVDLSPLIVQIRRAKLLSQTRRLDLTSLDKIGDGYQFDDYCNDAGSNWETATGTPRAILLDVEENKGRLVPIPVSNDTLELMVYRLPLETVTASSSELEVTDVRHQRMLLLEMKSLAYGKHDSDVNNVELSESYHLKFMSACNDVYWELKRARDKKWTTRSAWV